MPEVQGGVEGSGWCQGSGQGVPEEEGRGEEGEGGVGGEEEAEGEKGGGGQGLEGRAVRKVGQ